jgi:hypothetical protein
MAVAEIGNLATTLFNRLSAQDHSSSANIPAPGNVHATDANVLPADRFTPSAQQNSDQTAAQQAGLFQKNLAFQLQTLAQQAAPHLIR